MKNFCQQEFSDSYGFESNTSRHPLPGRASEFIFDAAFVSDRPRNWNSFVSRQTVSQRYFDSHQLFIAFIILLWLIHPSARWFFLARSRVSRLSKVNYKKSKTKKLVKKKSELSVTAVETFLSPRSSPFSSLVAQFDFLSLSPFLWRPLSRNYAWIIDLRLLTIPVVPCRGPEHFANSTKFCLTFRRFLTALLSRTENNSTIVL